MKTLVILGILNFLRTVLTILLVYYGLKLLGQFLAPYISKWVQKKAMEKMGNFQQGGFQQQKPKEDGEVTIDKNGAQKKGKSDSPTKDKGEYVDFEEVD
ncbi:DUF4834 family protein [Halosquirtibacter laminarini]|uniref:DUF4834 family protein n=1 Tax=Halosquirtibacter laminarini TaxID=3374600 RepID=A0AC61NDZ3_9BACT|nr:DUF4834 family protein [Prolixibacteraceae bacterium]